MRFSTVRLQVDECLNRYTSEADFNKLAKEVIAILTPSVTVALPPEWSNVNTMEKAQDWIRNRLSEGEVLTVYLKENQNLIGFVFLFELGDKEQGVAYRFGYLLAEIEWGKGLGTELITGLVRTCKMFGNVASVSGGVERNNLASIRVLEKIGFVVSPQDVATEDTIFYEYLF